MKWYLLVNLMAIYYFFKFSPVTFSLFFTSIWDRPKVKNKYCILQLAVYFFFLFLMKLIIIKAVINFLSFKLTTVCP